MNEPQTHPLYPGWRTARAVEDDAKAEARASMFCLHLGIRRSPASTKAVGNILVYVVWPLD